ncbi:MAG TPA: OsmC family protein [Jatrophihabitantaceae bacterium]|nr:OsmC family protein [Jatrophihabitantaceae bacterium]
MRWSGSTGVGYGQYNRDHVVEVLIAAGEPIAPVVDGTGLRMSGDAAFGGNGALLNPEQQLVMAAASCQMLSFLAVAARARLDVVDYVDDAVGEMPDADGWITAIRLSPVVTVNSDVAEDRLLHWTEVGHRECYIANSLRTDIRVTPRFQRAED